MSYEILDIEHGDVLAVYDSLDLAKQRLAGFLEHAPERADELGIATVDESGHAAAEMILGSHLDHFRVAG
jgi:hypothetical protein